MKKIIQFQVDNMGQIYFLYDDGTMAVGEQHHITENHNELKVEIIKKIRINDLKCAHGHDGECHEDCCP